jgi:hypothetical protein
MNNPNLDFKTQVTTIHTPSHVFGETPFNPLILLQTLNKRQLANP